MNKRNIPRLQRMIPQARKLEAQMQTRIDYQGDIYESTLELYKEFGDIIKNLSRLCDIASTPKTNKSTKQPTNDGEMRLQDNESYTKKSYWYDYGKTLYNMCYRGESMSDKSVAVYRESGYECFDKLIRLIYAWYQARIASRNIAKKAYRTEHVNQTIYAFVILFGYYHEMEYVYGEDNTLEDFINQVYDWISQLQTSEYIAKNMLYPRCVCDCINKPDPQMLTTSALILWELFIREGFSVFCEKYREYSDAPKIDGLEPLYQKLRPDILEMFNANDIESSCELYQIY